MNLNQVTVGTTDYARSVQFYKALGLTQIVDAPPHYARFETASGETFSIHMVDEISAASTMIYFECKQLDDRVSALEAAGIHFDSGPTDQDWGWREARFHDPDGNPLCLFRAGENRRFPPWRISDNNQGKGHEK